MATIRQQRVADLLFEELSIMISNELEDPRISYVDVTSVVISRDLRNAKAFVFHRDEEVTQKDVLRGLRDATPYMRRQIAQRCGLRMTPELLFYYDDTPEQAARIDELLSQIAQDRGEPEVTEASESSEAGESSAVGESSEAAESTQVDITATTLETPAEESANGTTKGRFDSDREPSA